MNALLAAAVLSLMLPIRMETGLILVRPFEFLIALGMLGWPLIAARRGVRVPVGLLLLLPYFTWHVASATVGGPRNAVREALQVLVVTMFAFLVAQEAPRLDMKRLSRRLLLGMAAIAAGTHRVAHRPRLLGGMEADPRPAPRVRLPAPAAGRVDPLRRGGKAPQASFRLGRNAPPARDVRRAQGARHLPHPDRAALRARPARPDRARRSRQPSSDCSCSRRWSRTRICRSRSARSSIPAEPATTNTCSPPAGICRAIRRATSSAPSPYTSLPRCSPSIRSSASAPTSTRAIVGETYPNAPEELRLAIHGEFQRILTENGLVGFSLYVLIWVAAWARLSRVLRRALDRGRLTSTQARVLPLLLFIPLALFVGTEASGTRAFIGVIIISLLPELVGGALARARTPMPLRSGLASSPYAGISLSRAERRERVRRHHVP